MNSAFNANYPNDPICFDSIGWMHGWSSISIQMSFHVPMDMFPICRLKSVANSLHLNPNGSSRSNSTDKLSWTLTLNLIN